MTVSGVNTPFDRDGVDGQLRPVDQLLDERTATTGLGCCRLDRRGQAGALVDERQSSLALAVGCLDDTRKRDLRIGRRERLRLQDAGRGEALALPRLGRREHCRRAVDRVRHAEVLCDPGGDPDGPVGAGRDEPVHRAGASEPLDGLLVLGRDHGALGREGEARSERIAIDGDHRQIARTCSLEQAELRDSGA